MTTPISTKHPKPISFSQNKVKLRSSFMGGVLGFKKNTAFDSKNIMKVSISKYEPIQSATRILGFHAPFIPKLGIYHSFRSRTWELWNTNTQDSNNSVYYDFYLKNEKYDRIVFKTDYDSEVISKLKSMNLSKYWDFGDYQTISSDIKLQASNHQFTGRIVSPAVQKARAKILMIPGSGPTDKDWNSKGLSGSNGSGKAIAELLAREGFVTLAFDKIGTMGNSHVGPISWSDYLEEQQAALGFLKEQLPLIKQTFVLGHSEGATHAIKLLESEKEKSINGLILLAPTGKPLQKIIESQVNQQVDKLPFVTKDWKERTQKAFQKGLDSIAEGTPKTPQELKLPLHLNKLYQVFCRPETMKYSEEIFKYDPKEHLLNIGKPVLIVGAGKDQQVDYEKDVQTLYDSTKSNPNIELDLVKDANHVFKYERKPLDKLGTFDALAYNREGRVVDPELIVKINEWLTKKNV